MTHRPQPDVAAGQGDKIVPAEHGAAKAQLAAPAAPRTRLRTPSGLLTIKEIPDDFDAPDEALIRLFEGQS